MATKIESLQEVSKALATYIEDVNLNISKMSDAAVDCHDNMEKDEFSKKAIGHLTECIGELKQSMLKANDLREKINALIKRIEYELDSF